MHWDSLYILCTSLVCIDQSCKKIMTIWQFIFSFQQDYAEAHWIQGMVATSILTAGWCLFQMAKRILLTVQYMDHCYKLYKSAHCAVLCTFSAYRYEQNFLCPHNEMHCKCISINIHPMGSSTLTLNRWSARDQTRLAKSFEAPRIRFSCRCTDQ